MICPKCGKTNEDGAAACTYCGADLTTLAEGKKKDSGGFFKKHKTLVIVATVLIVLIAGGSVAGYFINTSKNEVKYGAEAFVIDDKGFRPILDFVFRCIYKISGNRTARDQNDQHRGYDYQRFMFFKKATGILLFSLRQRRQVRAAIGASCGSIFIGFSTFRTNHF